MKRLRTFLITAILLLSLISAAVATDAAPVNVTNFSNYTPEELLQRWTELGTGLRLIGAYPFSELKRNDTGYEVTALQTQLAALGYYKKEIVENFGAGTYNALRAFEKAEGLKVNGVASPEDQQALYQAVAALTAGDTQADGGLVSTYSPDGMLQNWVQIGGMLRADGTYPYVQLRKGDVGYEVTMLQTRLQELGYYDKTVVDNFGSGTYNALRGFEKLNGLTVDGIASPEDQQALFASGAVANVQPAATKTDADQNDAASGATP